MSQIPLMILSLFLFSSCNKEEKNIEITPPLNMETNIQMVVQNQTFALSLYNNSTAQAILAMLPLTLNMQEMNGNEKYADLPQSLPTSTVRPNTIHNGDLMLYGSRTLVLFYKTFSSSYSYTKIGRVSNPSALEAALGRRDVSVRFEQIQQTVK